MASVVQPDQHWPAASPSPAASAGFQSIAPVSYRPEQLASEPPRATRRTRLAVVLGVLVLCLGTIAVAAYPRQGTLIVRLRTPSSAAEILVDGEAVCGNTRPCIVEDLEPGRRLVAVTVPGVATVHTAHVDIEAGKRHEVALDVPTAQGITVASDQPHVHLFVDHIERGELPLRLTDLTEGSHTLRFEAAGYTTLRKLIQVEAGKTLDLGSVQLAPVQPRLILALETEDARVVLRCKNTPDQVLSGPWPLQLDLDPGTYSLEATRPGYRPFRTVLELSKGQPPQKLRVELERVGSGSVPTSEPEPVAEEPAAPAQEPPSAPDPARELDEATQSRL